MSSTPGTTCQGHVNAWSVRPYALLSRTQAVFSRRMPRLDTVALGARVQAARKKAGLTQAQLAEAADVTDETLSRLERGKFAVAPETLVAIADALSASLDGLLGRDGRGTRVRARPTGIIARISGLMASLSPADQQLVLKLVEALARAADPKKSRTRR